MIRPKTAQSAGNAAIVIILIAVMIILYILFLPPEERAAILGEDGTGGNGGGTSSNGVLLSKNVGRIYPEGSSSYDHTMPSFIVFTVTNANELRKVDSIYVKNSAFSDQTNELVFYYDESTTTDVKLSYGVMSGEGRLRIILNGALIFEGDASGSPAPLSLSKEQLKIKNTLKFEVSDPGVTFWRVNEYTLEGVMVSAKVTDYTGSRAEQHFTITDEEFANMESAKLQFLPDCPPEGVGKLELMINSRTVYSGFPDCGVKTTIEVSKDSLKAQDNVLVGTTGQGSFLVDQPKITTKLKESAVPIFTFTVTPNLLDALYSGRLALALTLRFADSGKEKNGVLNINGQEMYFHTNDFIYQNYIDIGTIQDGPNSIKISPQSGPLDIVELRVDVVSDARY